MVDFRYHLVSIIAVFLALAVGIVLGTAALNGPIQDNLNANIVRLSSDKRVLQEDVQELRSQLSAADGFAASVGPGLVAEELDGERVVLVTTPQTPPELAEQLAPLLETAGAEVTGTLEVLPALSDPAQGPLVEDLVAQVVPAGVRLPDGEPVEQASAELAAVLVRAQGAPGVTADEAQAVLSAFGEADLVDFAAEGDAVRAASLALVLTGPAPEEDDDEDAAEAVAREQATLLSLVAALDARGEGAVVAGPGRSAAEGGPVAALRGDGSLAREVSSVDNADRGTGRVAVVLALSQEAAGRAGQYGAGGGASGPLPTPAP